MANCLTFGYLLVYMIMFAIVGSLIVGFWNTQSVRKTTGTAVAVVNTGLILYWLAGMVGLVACSTYGALRF